MTVESLEMSDAHSISDRELSSIPEDKSTSSQEVKGNDLEKQAPPSQQLTPRQVWIIVIGLMCGMLMAALDQTIVATCLPAILGDLGHLSDIGWVFVAYLLTSTAFMPLYGKVADIFGRKRAFLFAVVTFLVGSALCGASTTLIMLVISRAIQGVGAGGLMSLAMTIVADITPMRERGKYQGLMGAVFAVSSVCGPLLGGAFSDGISWRWVFYINLPIGAIAIAITFYGLTFTPIDYSKLKRVDFLGSLIIIGAVICIVLGANWGGDKYDWDSGVIISLFVIGGVLFIAFIVVELKVSADPIMPFKLFHIRNVLVSNFASFFIGYPMFGMISTLPLYFQVVHGSTATESGLQMIPLMGGLIVASVGSGIAISKTGRYNFFPAVGGVFLMIGHYLISLLDIDSNQGERIGYLLIPGIGVGLALQTLVLAAQNTVEPRYISVTTGSVNFFRTIGGVFGVLAYTDILNSELRKHVPSGVQAGSTEAIAHLPPSIKDVVLDAWVKAFAKAFLYAMPVIGVGLIVALFLKHIPLRKAPGGKAEVAPVDM